jgi:hypothetical protein
LVCDAKSLLFFECKSKKKKRKQRQKKMEDFFVTAASLKRARAATAAARRAAKAAKSENASSDDSEDIIDDGDDSDGDDVAEKKKKKKAIVAAAPTTKTVDPAVAATRKVASVQPPPPPQTAQLTVHELVAVLRQEPLLLETPAFAAVNTLWRRAAHEAVKVAVPLKGERQELYRAWFLASPGRAWSRALQEALHAGQWRYVERYLQLHPIQRGEKFLSTVEMALRADRCDVLDRTWGFLTIARRLHRDASQKHQKYANSANMPTTEIRERLVDAVVAGDSMRGLQWCQRLFASCKLQPIVPREVYYLMELSTTMWTHRRLAVWYVDHATDDPTSSLALTLVTAGCKQGCAAFLRAVVARFPGAVRGREHVSLTTLVLTRDERRIREVYEVARLLVAAVDQTTTNGGGGVVRSPDDLNLKNSSWPLFGAAMLDTDGATLRWVLQTWNVRASDIRAMSVSALECEYTVYPDVLHRFLAQLPELPDRTPFLAYYRDAPLIGDLCLQRQCGGDVRVFFEKLLHCMATTTSRKRYLPLRLDAWLRTRSNGALSLPLDGRMLTEVLHCMEGDEEFALCNSAVWLWNHYVENGAVRSVVDGDTAEERARVFAKTRASFVYLLCRRPKWRYALGGRYVDLIGELAPSEALACVSAWVHYASPSDDWTPGVMSVLAVLVQATVYAGNSNTRAQLKGYFHDAVKSTSMATVAALAHALI